MTPGVRCAGCGADLVPDPDRQLLRCAHCGAANLVRGRMTVPVGRLRPALDADDLPATLARFARRIDLARTPTLAAAKAIWIPYWVAPPVAPGSLGRAAAETPDPQLAERPLPAAEAEPLDETAAGGDDGWLWPDTGPAPGEVLRYAPWFHARLSLGGREIDAWVDRVDGEVLTAEPLNPERLRFSRRLSALLIAYAAGVLVLGALVPNPWAALAASVALGAAAWYPAHRLATDPGPRPAAGQRGDGP